MSKEVTDRPVVIIARGLPIGIKSWLFTIEYKSCCISIIFIIISSLTIIGCNNSKPDTNKDYQYSDINNIQSYDFGPTIISQSANLSHTYKFTNNNAEPLQVLAFENAKPCCGVVEEIKPTLLNRGEHVLLRVHLKQSEGEIVHRAILRTNDIKLPIQQFLTTAIFYPAYVIEAESGSSNPQIRVGDTINITYKAIAYSKVGEGENREQFDRITLNCQQKAEWVGSVETKPIGDRLLESSRKFEVALNGLEEVGSKSSEVTIRLNGGILATEIIRWEIINNFKISPNKILLSSTTANERKQIIVQSTNNVEFKIEKLSVDISGITAKVRTDSPGTMQLITIESIKDQNLAEQRFGSLRISTSGSSRELIIVPIIITH